MAKKKKPKKGLYKKKLHRMRMIAETGIIISAIFYVLAYSDGKADVSDNAIVMKNAADRLEVVKQQMEIWHDESEEYKKNEATKKAYITPAKPHYKQSIWAAAQ